jgi:hypothetical protein
MLLAKIEAWAGAHGISRSEALRRLVELGLNHYFDSLKRSWPNP